MNAKLVAVLFSVVLLMVTGQILFKLTAVSWQSEGTWLSTMVLVRLAASLVVYALATFAWIWVLQHVPLGRAYPFMALMFILVPLVSMWVFGETQGLRYYLGIVLICLGVSISASSPVSDSVTTANRSPH